MTDAMNGALGGLVAFTARRRHLEGEGGTNPDSLGKCSSLVIQVI